MKVLGEVKRLQDLKYEQKLLLIKLMNKIQYFKLKITIQIPSHRKLIFNKLVNKIQLHPSSKRISLNQKKMVKKVRQKRRKINRQIYLRQKKVVKKLIKKKI